MKSGTVQGPLCYTFPTLYRHSRKKNRSVREALHNDQCLRDLRYGNTLNIVTKVVRLNQLLVSPDTNLNVELSDSIRWTKEARTYTPRVD